MATVKELLSSVSTFTITLASLANSTAGVGRQSTIIDNTTNLYLFALISLAIKLGTSPTANSPIDIYLIRDNNDSTPLRDDGAGASDAGLTVKNAIKIATLTTGTAPSTGDVLKVNIDLQKLNIPLGPKWGIAIVNGSGVALDSTEANHIKSWIGIQKQTV